MRKLLIWHLNLILSVLLSFLLFVTPALAITGFGKDSDETKKAFEGFLCISKLLPFFRKRCNFRQISNCIAAALETFIFIKKLFVDDFIKKTCIAAENIKVMFFI